MRDSCANAFDPGGPTGCWKRNSSSSSAEHYKIPHISTGDIFRANIKGGTELGKLAQSYMDAGNLVPDSVTNSMVEDRLGQSDVGNGFLLDGYPRNVGQAEFLDGVLNAKGAPLDSVLELSIANDEIIKRLSGRRICRGCGASFHIHFEKPSKDGLCDKCGGELYQRQDDNEATIANRLNVYTEQTEPIIEYYKKAGLLKVISATGAVSEITTQAISALK